MYNYAKLIFGLLTALYFTACNQNKLQLQTIDNVQLQKNLLKVEVLDKGLDVPWDICYADDHSLFIAEQGGVVSRIDLATGHKKQLLKITEVWRKRTAGLLGLVVHPKIKEKPYLFVNYTVKKDTLILSRLVRYEITKDTLKNAKTLLEVDGYTAHNGSRLAIGPDQKLYWATGDAYFGEKSQDPKSSNGKILRINIDGTVPSDNPTPNSYVWASGFRNMQGLTFSDKGLLYTSEHGDAIEDEINLIEKGKNYGWPAIEGKEDLPAEKAFALQHHTTPSIKSWTPVIAPAGITYHNGKGIPEWANSLLLTTLKGKSLRVIKLTDDGRSTKSEEIFFEKYYGRLRDVCTDKDGAVYIATSNRDWNPSQGFPLVGDDKILKISKADQATHKVLSAKEPEMVNRVSGKNLYLQYCASCHKEDGKGVLGTFPALAGSAKVNANPKNLIPVLLNGINNQGAGGAMPAFNFLKDDEAAAILTYIRKNWGNTASAITPLQINKNR
ncbi:MAG: c-type cytochrome [Pedobacter sp.]|nr:MAG: c-type cytochrome [Pedobacter sp.]